MVKNFKIIIFIIFIALIIFLIFSNMDRVIEAERIIPSNEEINEFSNVQIKNSANTYEVKSIPDKELATIYYNHYKDLLVNDSEEAYSRIRNKNMISEEEFNEFRNNIINNYYGSKVEEYQIMDSIYRITTNSKDTIVFYVDAVFQYEVELLIWFYIRK